MGWFTDKATPFNKRWFTNSSNSLEVQHMVLCYILECRVLNFAWLKNSWPRISQRPVAEIRADKNMGVKKQKAREEYLCTAPNMYCSLTCLCCGNGEWENLSKSFMVGYFALSSQTCKLMPFIPGKCCWSLMYPINSSNPFLVLASFTMMSRYSDCSRRKTLHAEFPEIVSCAVHHAERLKDMTNKGSNAWSPLCLEWEEGWQVKFSPSDLCIQLGWL